MVMPVDQSGNYEMVGRIERFRARGSIRRQVAADRDDVGTFDEDICHGRPVDVAVMVINASAGDQESSLVQFSFPQSGAARSSREERP